MKEEFADKSKERSDARQRTNLDDLQREVAGVDIGREERFLTAEPSRHDRRKTEEKRSREAMSRLQTLLLTNPAYAAQYNAALGLLSRYENAAERALSDALEAVETASARLEELRQSANRLPDGTRVYKDQEGIARTENGTVVPADDLDGVVWQEGAPMFEDLSAANAALGEAEQRRDETRGYQVDVLGNARNRLEDEDNPPSPEEIGDIVTDIEKRAPEAVIELTALDNIQAPAVDFAATTLPKLKN